MHTNASGVGSIIYVMVCSHPDLAYVVSTISIFMAIPGRMRWEVLKSTLRYLKGTSNLGLLFERRDEASQPVVGYVDSCYAGNVDTRKSLTGFIFSLYGTTMHWKASLQFVVAPPTTEAKYIALTKAIKEEIWLKGITGELVID
ncbi:secreted RxLR effector protein 161-like [Primulina huaijiensis]|uniref:secreted RxLR effector protein 161-like n=1 Tax=Primulina huaijiensis TaxID=1492673 RepID=UPI003CC74C22